MCDCRLHLVLGVCAAVLYLLIVSEGMVCWLYVAYPDEVLRLLAFRLLLLLLYYVLLLSTVGCVMSYRAHCPSLMLVLMHARAITLTHNRWITSGWQQDVARPPRLGGHLVTFPVAS
jgi:hypothetical protein